MIPCIYSLLSSLCTATDYTVGVRGTFSQVSISHLIGIDLFSAVRLISLPVHSTGGLLNHDSRPLVSKIEV